MSANPQAGPASLPAFWEAVFAGVEGPADVPAVARLLAAAGFRRESLVLSLLGKRRFGWEPQAAGPDGGWLLHHLTALRADGRGYGETLLAGLRLARGWGDGLARELGVRTRTLDRRGEPHTWLSLVVPF
jgi:hypothetical protein